MINVNDKKIKELSASLHEKICRKAKQAGDDNDDIILENRLFYLLCDDPGIHPAKCAVKLNEKYGYDLSGDDIITVFRRCVMAFPEERVELFNWVYQLIDLFEGAVNGKKDAVDKFDKKRKENAVKSGKPRKSQDRICVIMILRRFPKLFMDEDVDVIFKLGNTYARYLFFDLCDIICETYGFPTYKETKNGRQSKKTQPLLTLEQAVKKIDLLEDELERTNNMLSDLQKEFSEQLAESQIKELTDFFAKLNSEKYGCILDQLLGLQKGVNEMRKNGVEVPLQINGVLIVVKKLIQFIKDSHIAPIMKPDSEKKVKASDVEFCDYIGTPFNSETEVKKVRTLSPGWKFKDEIQISRPRVEEVHE